MIVATAPGKVNLALLVAKPDERGYHPLYSIFETLNLREQAAVEFRPLNADTGPASISVRTVGEMANVGLEGLDPKRHLAWRAAKALADEAEKRGREGVPEGMELHVEITKRVPVAGGMAGGSADAAATLVAVNELLGLELQRDELHAIGRSLGADVPACLEGGISLGLGYGDHMTRLDTPETPRHHWVMCTMSEGLSTPAVFKHFDAAGRGREELPVSLRSRDLAALGDAEMVSSMLENDLESSARELHPALNRAWSVVENAGALAVVLSGSGPTIAALARDEEHARELAERLGEAPEIERAIAVWGPAAPASNVRNKL